MRLVSMFGVTSSVVYIPPASQTMDLRCPEVVRVFCVRWWSPNGVLIRVITKARQAIRSPDLYPVTGGKCLILLETCVRGLVCITHEIELARCCRVGDIRVGCSNGSQRQDGVIVLSHIENWDIRDYMKRRRETIFERRVEVAIACFKQSRTSSFMLMKINTQAYEVIVCEPCPSPTPSRGWLANGSSISYVRRFVLKTAQCLSSYVDIDVGLGSASEESLVEERKYVGLSSIQETLIR